MTKCGKMLQVFLVTSLNLKHRKSETSEHFFLSANVRCVAWENPDKQDKQITRCKEIHLDRYLPSDWSTYYYYVKANLSPALFQEWILRSK